MCEVDDVIELSKSIVCKVETRYGYGDVGDVLVRYLRKEIDESESRRRLHGLGLDYERYRAQDEMRSLK